MSEELCRAFIALHVALALALASLAALGQSVSAADARAVREEYAVVYRPRSVSFDAPMMAGGELVQPVHLTDAGDLNGPAAPKMGAAYWIPAFWVPALLVTHYITFLYLLKHWKGSEWLPSSPSSIT
jgi:hypothetical protein